MGFCGREGSERPTAFESGLAGELVFPRVRVVLIDTRARLRERERRAGVFSGRWVAGGLGVVQEAKWCVRQAVRIYLIDRRRRRAK